MSLVRALKSIVRKNSTGSDFIRRRVNLIEGTNVTLTVADDSANDEIDVTIAAAGGGGTTYTLATPPPWHETFMGGTDSSGQIGDRGWQVAGGGVQHYPPDTGGGATAGSYGEVGLYCLDTTLSYLYHTTENSSYDVRAEELWDIEFRVKPQTTTVSDLMVRFGLFSAVGSNPPADGAYIEKLYADTGAFGVSRVGSTSTRTASLGTLTNNTWATFRVRRIDASNIGFTMNRGTELPLSNSNTGGRGIALQIVNQSTQNSWLHIDDVLLQFSGTLSK